MQVDPDREVALVGGLIAAASGVVLFGSLVVDWYQRGQFCVPSACGNVTVTGFSALGAVSVLLVGGALAASLPIGAAFADARLLRPLSGVATAAGLGCALFVVFRIAAPPSPVPSLPELRLAGPFIALLGATGTAFGAALAGLGRRLFDPAPRPELTLGVIVAACVVLFASLAVPWVRTATRVVTAPGVGAQARSETAWQAAPTLAVILLLGTIAIVCACGLVWAIRWRAAFYALSLGGWLAAAIAAVGMTLATRSKFPVSGGSYQPGYYVCLASAAVIVFAGVLASVADD